jgi:outer membrane protein assembly factor BamB
MIRRFGCLAFLCAAVFPLLHAQQGEAALPPDAAAGSSVGNSAIWREALEGMVTGIPSVQGETVVVVLDGGNLKAYSRRGTLLWEYFAGGKLCPAITRSPEGTSYICRTNGTFIVINRAGRELWRLGLAAPLSAPVLVGWDGRLFIPCGDLLVCYTAAGYPLWGTKLPAPIALAPVADKRGGLLLVLENRALLSVDPFGKIHSLPLPAIPAAIAPLDGADPEKPDALIFYRTGAAAALRREAGGNFTVSSGGFPGLPSPPLAAAGRGDRAALALADGRVALFSGSGGGILWTGESHLGSGDKAKKAEEEVAMLFDERGIYVLSRTGATAFAEDGRRLWILELEGASSVPAFSDEGVLFSGGEDWILYAYETEKRRRSLARSLYGPLPEGSYGLGVPPPASWEDYAVGFGEIDAYLKRMREDISVGRVGENERVYAGYLMELSGSFIRTPGASPVRPPVHLNYRIEGARLLGYIGSRETVPFLVGLLFYEREPLVKAAAAEAIGRIGVDPDGLALRVFSALLTPGAPGIDERPLKAIAAAAGALCRFSGPPLSGEGIKILRTLMGAGYPTTVRTQAKEELDSLRR